MPEGIVGSPPNYTKLPDLPPDPTPEPITDDNKCWTGYHVIVAQEEVGHLLKYDRAGNEISDTFVNTKDPNSYAKLIEHSLQVINAPLKDPLPKYPKCIEYQFTIE